MRQRLLHAAILFAAIAAAMLPRSSHAQPVTTRVFEGITAGESGGVPDVRISFNMPIRYLRHSPRERGESLNIQFFPLNVSDTGALELFQRESLQLPRNLPAPIVEVVFEGVVAGRPILVLRLAKSVRFDVRQGSDLRSIVIAFPPEATAGTTPTDPPAAGTDAGAGANPNANAAAPRVSDQRAEEMLKEGRRAMTAGEFDRAVLIFTKVLSHSDGAPAQEALELLGLARERTGQLAHAKAEYEAYLERYPKGESAERVRQRLEALVTARAEAPESRRIEPPESKPLDLTVFGSTYVGYRRQNLYPRGNPVVLADSSLFTDLHLEARLRTDNYTLRSQYTGGYRYEFLDGGSDESRTNSLFVEAEDHPNRLQGFIGRRSMSTAGILGRFDGMRVTYGLGERFTLGAAGGFPVDYGSANTVQTDLAFAGISLDVAEIAENVNAQVYAIGQWDGGRTDRMAVGTEIHYFDQGRFAAVFLDYDVYFQKLNLAQLIGNWQVTPSTLLTTYLAYRLVPALTAQNALQGQAADEVADLRDDFSDGEIKELARDRTASSTTLTFGVNHFLTDRLQLSADFTASEYSGTRASENVDAISGTGFEFSYSSQLIWNDFLRQSGIGILGVRFFDGSENDFLSATLDGRYPITRDLRLNPRLLVNYRMSRSAGDVFSLIPSLRLDYRIWKMSFDAEVGGEWLLPMSNSGTERRLGYSISVGLRYDY
jgi:hypothetical protein